MLGENKELFRTTANMISGWEEMSKNDLCRAYVKNKDNKELADAYFAAIMFKYWNLISKYYYMSKNVATPEDCYEWLEDSVLCCVNMKMWEVEGSSIYNDPNGPDKVINRCMKCARLTYYQFINRKKRRDNFGMLSLDELSELFGTTISEPQSSEDVQDGVTTWAVVEYIQKLFKKKEYFLAIMLDCIQTQDVFDITVKKEKGQVASFNIRKLTKFMSNLTDTYLMEFAQKYMIPIDIVLDGASYFRYQKSPTIKGKIQNNLEKMKHDSFFKMLHGE